MSGRGGFEVKSRMGRASKAERSSGGDGVESGRSGSRVNLYTFLPPTMTMA
jgi:hypothetical protein